MRAEPKAASAEPSGVKITDAEALKRGRQEILKDRLHEAEQAALDACTAMKALLDALKDAPPAGWARNLDALVQTIKDRMAERRTLREALKEKPETGEAP